MILVVGGLASGKRAYLRSLGFSAVNMADGFFDARPALANAHELVRNEAVDPVALAAELAEKQAITCCDVGSGIIPLDAGERRWRDRAGLLAQELAARASAVVRMTCGIPQALKGQDPRTGVTELVIIRHGSTPASERRAYTGCLDVPLSPAGEAEARALGIHPDIETVFTSPLARAQTTARICFPHAMQMPMDGLREMDFGAFQGRTADEMADDAAYRTWVDGGCEGRCPNGEDKGEFIERVSRTIHGIVLDAVAEGRRHAIIVAHGGTIMAAMTAFARTLRGYHDWGVPPCQGYRMTARFEGGQLAFEGGKRFDTLAFLDERAPFADAAHPASHAFFQNRACRYFPCHEGIDEHEFNCLFCYCPLYALGPRCGGDFTYTKAGRKNCTGCTIPHQGERGTRLVAEHYEQLAALACE